MASPKTMIQTVHLAQQYIDAPAVVDDAKSMQQPDGQSTVTVWYHAEGGAAKAGFREAPVEGTVLGALVVQALLRDPATRAGALLLVNGGQGNFSFTITRPMYAGDRIRVDASADASFRTASVSLVRPAPVQRRVGSPHQKKDWLCVRSAFGFDPAVLLLPEPRPGDFPRTPLPDYGRRHPCAAASLWAGRRLGSLAFTADRAFHRRLIAEDYAAADLLDVFADDGGVHPSLFLEYANKFVRFNFNVEASMGWLHLGSRVQFFGAASVGEPLVMHGRVKRAFRDYLGGDAAVFDLAVCSERRRGVCICRIENFQLLDLHHPEKFASQL